MSKAGLGDKGGGKGGRGEGSRGERGKTRARGNPWFDTGAVIQFTSSESEFLVQPPPPECEPYPIEHTQALQVRYELGTSNAAVFSVFLGRMESLTEWTAGFVREEGVPPFAMKCVYHDARSKIDDELKAEMLVNTNITTPDPEKGFEVVLATFCWSKAKYKLSKNVSKPKEMWLGDGELRVLLTTEHLALNDAFRNWKAAPKFTKAEEVLLHRACYKRLRDLHKIGWAHRDCKYANFVVRMSWSEEHQQFGPVGFPNELDVYLIDLRDAKPLKEAFKPGDGKDPIEAAGTSTYLSLPVVIHWVEEHFLQAVKSNPRIREDLSGSQEEAVAEAKAALGGGVLWTRDDVNKFQALLTIGSLERVSAETDVWSLGISTIKHLKNEYVAETCFKESWFDEFKKMMPLKKEPKTMEEMWIYMTTLREFFSPLYEEKTWKGCVEECYHGLIEEMLSRPSVGSYLAPLDKNEDRMDKNVVAGFDKILANARGGEDQARPASPATAPSTSIATPSTASKAVASDKSKSKSKVVSKEKVAPSHSVARKPYCYHAITGHLDADNRALEFRDKDIESTDCPCGWDQAYDHRPLYTCIWLGCKGRSASGTFANRSFADFRTHVDPNATPHCQNLESSEPMSITSLRLRNHAGDLQEWPVPPRQSTSGSSGRPKRGGR